MKSPLPTKAPASVSASVHHRLNMYALAAGAAGVGMLASAQPMEAKIVYTPTHRQLLQNQSLNLDLNHDGTADFSLKFYRLASSSSGNRLVVSHLSVKGLGGANAVRTTGTRGFAAALGKGAIIGAGKRFSAGDHYLASCFSHATINGHTSHRSAGPWLNLRQGYLGVKFTIAGKIHYGWVRLTHPLVKFSCRGGNLAGTFLTGYAYETIPGKAIIAGATKGLDDTEPTASLSPRTPEPATLGLLALGAPGLSIWRREESSTS